MSPTKSSQGRPERDRGEASLWVLADNHPSRRVLRIARMGPGRHCEAVELRRRAERYGSQVCKAADQPARL